MVVASHSRGAQLYSSGQVASAGMKLMAETGATSILEQELAGLGAQIGAWSKGARIDVPSNDSVTLEFDGQHPLLTMVSMIAPSPDWFVGVSGLTL